MKKSYIIGVAALAAVGMASCQDDKDPKISTATEFHLNIPPMANQTMILTPDGTATFTVSQPNYGLTLAPTYGIEISMKEDFTQLTPGNYTNADGEEVPIPAYVVIPLESQIRGVLVAKESNIAAAINAMRGIGSEADYTEAEPSSLFVRATSIVAGQPSTAITSNVIELKYVKDYFALNSDPYADCLYTPGGANGWSFDSAMRIPNATGENDAHPVYKGYMVVKGEFKFTHQPEWTHPGDYGTSGDFAKDANGVWTGTLQESGGNFSGVDDGLYWVEVTITNEDSAEGQEAGSFKLVPITKVGIVGNAMGWDNDVVMTPDAGFTTWTAENVDLGDGGWKFRMNGGWDYNLGGKELNDLTQNGDNLTPGGTHTVILDLSTLPYSARLQ